MEFRHAAEADIDRIMELIQQAKDYLKSLGVDQWQSGYPDRASIQGDAAAKNGYVLMDGEEMAGYACISFDGEEAYNGLKGEWKSQQPYAVVHRMAIADTYKGKGLANRFFGYTQELCEARGLHSIKIDTDSDNLTMQHLLKKNGFEYCGVICFDNSDKIAFEKLF